MRVKEPEEAKSQSRRMTGSKPRLPRVPSGQRPSTLLPDGGKRVVVVTGAATVAGQPRLATLVVEPQVGQDRAIDATGHREDVPTHERVGNSLIGVHLTHPVRVLGSGVEHLSVGGLRIADVLRGETMLAVPVHPEIDDLHLEAIHHGLDAVEEHEPLGEAVGDARPCLHHIHLLRERVEAPMNEAEDRLLTHRLRHRLDDRRVLHELLGVFVADVLRE